ncbi:aminotransferase class IV [Altibacter sp. HG106]|uniref:aminotransferase class IV n=1 Tax=Altibacter sp. HG106 TaxID=3023937 RepID=UPI0023504FD6|nr:aminotransferase class IV [Altibacter sp. HG106]MDC7993717.1 aminotransferase class IV [Altibacter sp. HG106]
MINLNGTLQPNTQILEADNRGLAYGDALFETIRVSAGKILFWEDHYFRLMASMRMLRMEIPMTFTMEYLEAEIFKTLSAVEDTAAAYRVKVQVWRKPGGTYTPRDRGVHFMITCQTLKTPFYSLNKAPYEVELFKDYYLPSGMLSTLKTNNKIINVLGSIYAEENEYQNCLLLNEKKEMVEALNGNLFLVDGYKIKTPPLESGCLNGILRKQIFAILAKMPDYILEEATVSPFELQKVDELFITNTIVGIQPITKYRKKEYTSEVAQELLGKLNAKARLG